MKKSKKSVRQSEFDCCQQGDGVQPCEKPVNNPPSAGLFTLSEGLLAGCDPVILPVVHTYLDDPDPDTLMFLDAWERCGRGDAATGMRVELNRTARQTLTPLGIACLVRYARGLEDELQARAVRAEQEANSSALAQGGGSSRRQEGRAKSRPSRSTAGHTPRPRRRSR